MTNPHSTTEERAELEAMIAEEIRDGITTDIHFDLRGVERTAELIASKIPALLDAGEPVAWTGSGSLAYIKGSAWKEGYIWGESAPSHPLPLFSGPSRMAASSEGEELRQLRAFRDFVLRQCAPCRHGTLSQEELAGIIFNYPLAARPDAGREAATVEQSSIVQVAVPVSEEMMERIGRRMRDEYMRDECCDYVVINKLIEALSDALDGKPEYGERILSDLNAALAVPDKGVQAEPFTEETVHRLWPTIRDWYEARTDYGLTREEAMGAARAFLAAALDPPDDVPASTVRGE